MTKEEASQLGERLKDLGFRIQVEEIGGDVGYQLRGHTNFSGVCFRYQNECRAFCDGVKYALDNQARPQLR